MLENSQKWDSTLAVGPIQGYGYECATPYTESKQQSEDFYNYNYEDTGARPKHRRIESDIVRLPGNMAHTLPIKSTIHREDNDELTPPLFPRCQQHSRNMSGCCSQKLFEAE